MEERQKKAKKLAAELRMLTEEEKRQKLKKEPRPANPYNNFQEILTKRGEDVKKEVRII